MGEVARIGGSEGAVCQQCQKLKEYTRRERPACRSAVPGLDLVNRYGEYGIVDSGPVGPKSTGRHGGRPLQVALEYLTLQVKGPSVAARQLPHPFGDRGAPDMCQKGSVLFRDTSFVLGYCNAIGLFQAGKFAYSSQLLTVLGKGMASRMLPTPVMYMTMRSKPRPKPAWRAEPYLRRSR